MKQELPTEIAAEMKRWRAGYGSLGAYITWHRELAEARLDELREVGRIHDWCMSDDGWMDGMQVVHVQLVVDEQTLNIKWNDGSQLWFVELATGGWVPFRGVAP